MNQENVTIPAVDYQRLCAERNEARGALVEVVNNASRRSNLGYGDIPKDGVLAAKENNIFVSKIITVCQRGLGEHK